MLQTLALATLVSFAPAQGDDLKLTNARSTYGVLGAPRESNKLLPGDQFWLSFDIENITVDPKNGEVLYSMSIELLDSKGNKKFGKKPQDLKAVNFFGGTSVPAFAHIDIGSDTDPGQYTLAVAVTDRAANPKRSATVKKNFEVLDKGFGIVRLATSYDSYGQTPAPNVGVAGQFYWVSFWAVGFERDGKKQPNIALEMSILDDKGKPTISEPLTGEAASKVPAEISAIPLQFQVNLNRPGKFTVQLKATDKLGKKTSEVSFPLTVLDSNPK